ncbi:hypothetical protein C8R46DRAFT_1198600 [Mycena filopes]|nr:hypothetical protein C8R46DRAFT_1198600 [Mycena filopes]
MDSSDERSPSTVYPVLTLPPEIVSEIFVSFLPSYPEPPPKTGLLSPYLLCQICRQWRAIAASTPDLWRAIPLNLSRASSQAFAAAQIELADTWLARSGTRPLSIRLICTSDLEISPSLRTLFDKIVLHCDRWEYLRLVVPFDLFAFLDGNMPLLRALTVGLNNYSYPYSSVLTPFPRALELRSVLLTESFTTALVLPWAQLTRLESRCLYIYECLSILDAAPQLLYCQFTVSDAVPFPPELPTNISHTRLRQLIVDTDNDDDDDNDEGSFAADLLDRLTLPALQTLQVFEPCITMDALKGLISRSGSIVEKLLVTGSSVGQSVYREVFSSIPAIDVVYH